MQEGSGAGHVDNNDYAPDRFAWADPALRSQNGVTAVAEEAGDWEYAEEADAAAATEGRREADGALSAVAEEADARRRLWDSMAAEVEDHDSWTNEPSRDAAESVSEGSWTTEPSSTGSWITEPDRC